MTKSKKGMEIRWMIRRDYQEVADIESKCFFNPISLEKIALLLKGRMTIGLVAILSDQVTGKEFVAGYIIYDLKKDHIKIRRFVVHPNCRRIGIGREILGRMIEKLNPNRFEIKIVLRETNLKAQLFLRSQNFKVVQIIKEKYNDNLEDAYVMKYSILNDLEFQGIQLL